LFTFVDCITVKLDVLLPATLQYCPTILQFWQGVCSEQFASDENKLQVEIHKRFVKKLSDWTISKKEGYQIVWATGLIGASLFLIAQSQALFTNLLWISTCNLFASLANCSEQSPYQYCNIVRQYCNVASKRTSRLTVNCCEDLLRLSHSGAFFKWFLQVRGHAYSQYTAYP
jgi:hypothetical protein